MASEQKGLHLVLSWTVCTSPRAMPTWKAPGCRGLKRNNPPRLLNRPIPWYRNPQRPRPALPVSPALRGPQASQGTERGAGGWRHPTPQLALHVQSRGLSRPNGQAPRGRAVGSGGPHAVRASEAGAKGRTATPQSGRYMKKGGTGSDGEPRVTRLQGQGPLGGGDTSGRKGHGEGKGPGVGRLVRWGEDGVRGAVAGNGPAQWTLVPMAIGDHRRQPSPFVLFSVFRVNRSPTLTETTQAVRVREARMLLDLGAFQGPERHPRAPGGAITPRNARPGRNTSVPRPCPLAGRCPRPERAYHGGFAAGSPGPRHPPIGGAAE